MLELSLETFVSISERDGPFSACLRESRLTQKSYRKVRYWDDRWWLAVELLQHFLGSFHAVILSFLEDGDAAEIGVGEQDAAIEP